MMDLHCCETADNEIFACVDQTLLHDRVLKNMLKNEDLHTPTCTTTSTGIQREVTVAMRNIVAEWMMEVCDEQKCQDEVFLLAMNYLNRFLLLCSIKKNQLQLLGAACMLLASKFREPKPIAAEILVFYTDHSITKDMLTKWELLVLSKLKWEIAAIVPVDFLHHLLLKLHVDSVGIKHTTVKKHAKILITLCAKEYRFAGYNPSKLACASVASALGGLGWTTRYQQSFDDLLERLQQITSVDKDMLRECVIEIEKMVQESSNSHSLKTGSNAYDEVERPEEFTPPPEKMYSNYKTAITPTDVHDIHF